MFVDIRIEIFVKNLGIYLSQVQVKSITYRGNRQGHIKSGQPRNTSKEIIRCLRSQLQVLVRWTHRYF